MKNVVRVSFLFLILAIAWTTQVQAESYSDAYGRVVRKCAKLLGIDETRYSLRLGEISTLTTGCGPIGTTAYPSGLTSFTLDLLNEPEKRVNPLLQGARPFVSDQMAGRAIDPTGKALLDAARDWIRQEHGISDVEEQNRLIINAEKVQ